MRSNLRLVVNVAKNYADRGMSLADLIEEGNVGLIKAVDYFNPDHGTRFSTYAAWWIKQGIKRSLLQNVQPLHIPTYMVTLMNQWRHVSSELGTKLGRPPTVEEMAEVMNLPLRKSRVIDEVVKIITPAKETGADNGDNEDQNFETTLQDQFNNKPGYKLEADEEKAKVLRLLNDMNEREANILRLHYGLNDKKPLTIRQIGEKLGLTRERIRQIQRAALTKLYEYMNAE